MGQYVAELEFVPITRAVVGDIEDWFDDPDTQRFLGGREWPRLIPELVGAESDGVLGRDAWVVHSAGDPVGIVDVERYDDGTAAIALAVAPAMRGRGIGTRILRDVQLLDELSEVTVFTGSVDPDNGAAQRCLRSARFEVADEEDDEGMMQIACRRA